MWQSAPSELYPQRILSGVIHELVLLLFIVACLPAFLQNRERAVAKQPPINQAPARADVARGHGLPLAHVREIRAPHP